MKTILAVASTLLLVLSSSRGADLGGPAAELKIAQWVKGEPIDLSDDKNIYVVEFWATWCPPCRTSIPHLTEIQKRFKDKNVAIIGVTDEKESIVEPFVKNMAAKMDYRVAIDDSRGTSEGYMRAYGVNGIPHAFIVREKKVLWHGHPMAGLDKALEEITAGTYDISKTKAQFQAEALLEKFRRAAAEGDDAEADKLAGQIEAAAKEGSLPLASFDAAAEKKKIRLMVLQNSYRNALFRDQKDQAEKLGKELKELDPSVDLQAFREEMALHKLAGSYFETITGEGSSSDRKERGQQLAAKLKNQPEIANNIAWTILTDGGVKHRDTDFAAQVAKQACEDSDWKQPHIVDTYARALFDSGKKEEAIENQQKAIAIAKEGEKAQYERTLKAYKEGKVPGAE